MTPDAARAEVEALRRRIDAIDDRLLALLGERLRVAEALAPPKTDAGLPARDPAREAEVIARLTARGVAPADAVALVWSALFGASRWVQAVPPPER